MHNITPTSIQNIFIDFNDLLLLLNLFTILLFDEECFYHFFSKFHRFFFLEMYSNIII